MKKQVPQVPYATKGSASYEGKHIIDKPLLIKSCKKCMQPVHYKKIPSGREERLYCPACKKFRRPHNTMWLPRGSKIRFVTDIELLHLIEIALQEEKMMI